MASTQNGMPRYEMNHDTRRLCLIINNKNFRKDTCVLQPSRPDMYTRGGNDKEVESLQRTFEKLGFEVRYKENLTMEGMKNEMKEVQSYYEEDKGYDCFACVILTYCNFINDTDKIYAVDGLVELNSLVEHLKGDKCPNLLGKPKLFFIQACPSKRLPECADDTSSSKEETKKCRLPMEADLLYAYSTAPGNPLKGGRVTEIEKEMMADAQGWFVGALSHVLYKYGTVFDKNGEPYGLATMLTLVNRMVAHLHQNLLQKRRMTHLPILAPCIVSQLRKDLCFTTKPQ